MSDPVRYHVFLSHATPDKPAVKEIAGRLKAEGIEPWLDEWNLIPGDAWQTAIEEALRQCTTCAVFVGEGGFGAWQNEEMRAAISRRVRESAAARGKDAKPFRVIPVLLPSGQPPEYSRLPEFLQATTWVVFRDSLDDAIAFHRLVCGVRGVEPGAAPGEMPPSGECPYRGLESFDERQANLFFGRERMTQELVFKLRPPTGGQENRFLAILGTSGSGKSSLAKAGLVPALRRGEISGSDLWPIVVFRPGRDPIESLAVVLAAIDGSTPSAVAVQGLMAGLKAEENTLHVAARLALRDAPPERRAMFLVDQFEEVFTLCENDPIRQAFFANLIYAATIAGGRTVVVLTMRADFYGKCGPYPALGAALSERQFLIGPMTAEELRQAIERPARLAGGEFDPGLVEVLLGEVVDRPAALPMLEFALTELWQRRDGRRLTVAAYRAIGGLEGALSHRADEVLATFDDAQRTLCRRIFLRLTQPGEGTEDTKRRATFAELVSAGADAEDVESVVNRLADARLITTGEAIDLRQRSVDVAHEALIRGWDKLRQWLNADRAGHLTYLGLIARTREWDQSGRDSGLLDTGARLATAREWNESHPGELDPSGVDFLAAGLVADRQRKEVEQAAALRLATAEARARQEAAERASEAAESAKEREREAARRARERAVSQRYLITALGAGLAVASLLAVVAFWQYKSARTEASHAKDAEGQAREQAKLAGIAEEKATREAANARAAEDRAKAETRHANVLRLASQAALREREQFDLGLLLSVEAYRAEPNYETYSTLFATSRAHPRLVRCQHGHRSAVYGVSFSPDGKALASSSGDGSIILWDVATGKPRGRPLTGHRGIVYGVAFSPDGHLLASASADGTVIVWDTTTGKPRGRPLIGHKSEVHGVAFSPDGRTLASASPDKTVILWDVTTRRPRRKPLAGHEDFVWCLAFSPDGQTLASAGATIILWDTTTGTPRGKPLVGYTGGSAYGLAFSPDSKTLAAASWNNSVVLWDVATGEPHPAPLVGHKGPVHSVAYSPDGKILVSASFDDTVVLWDAETGQPRGEPLTGHTDDVNCVAISPDGQFVASASNDKTVILWDMTANPRGEPLAGHVGAVYGLAYSPDSQTLASASRDSTIILRDVRTGQPRGRRLARHRGEVLGVAYSPDGQTLASASFDKTVILWDAKTGQPRREPLVGHNDGVVGVSFSPDSQTLASASYDQTVILWDAKTGEPRGKPLTGHQGLVRGVAYSPDGQTLATASYDKTVILWDAATGQPRGRPLTGHKGPVCCVTFSPDGKTLATASEDKTVLLWDATTGKQNGSVLTGHKDHVTCVAYSPDGTTLASGSADRTVILWDAKTGEQRCAPLAAHGGPVNGVAFSPDGKTLASASTDQSVILWDLDPETQAIRRAGRNLSLAEWKKYIGPDVPYRLTSPEFPPGEGVRAADFVPADAGSPRNAQ
jgi:WD40 repeat protein